MLKQRPIKKLSGLFNDFFHSEKAGGIVLLCCTIVSLIIANSVWSDDYLHIWHYKLGEESVEHWINDGLMAIFFLLIGLELEREIYAGELSSIKNALLPVTGALGGMLVPAAIYVAFNLGTITASGSGIPMATDIAFALGILALLGNRVPASLKIFLTALAVIDDLGAIVVIAVFYTGTLVWMNLMIALAIFVVLLILNKLKVKNLIPYLLLGGVMWYFMLHSGVHATITGVLVAFAIPFGKGDEKSGSYRLQKFLHRPVAFFILPVFALANTAIIIHTGWQMELTQPYALGIMAGLIIGKPLGIFLFSYLSVKFKICKLPSDLQWKDIIGVGFLGGIGFTMSIFITLLAFTDADIINNAKLMIMIGSLIAGIIGFIWLKLGLSDNKKMTDEQMDVIND